MTLACLELTEAKRSMRRISRMFNLIGVFLFSPLPFASRSYLPCTSLGTYLSRAALGYLPKASRHLRGQGPGTILRTHVDNRRDLRAKVANIGVPNPEGIARVEAFLGCIAPRLTIEWAAHTPSVFSIATFPKRTWCCNFSLAHLSKRLINDERLFLLPAVINPLQAFYIRVC
ncbi:hypothetical protein F4677DRAFT_411453 [Hypoxylon crocopeplum]|nr:hypothetical protein F4677DRAFT_411453 [Hypoxylon crocopeplum]